jgi:hypothetical protein
MDALVSKDWMIQLSLQPSPASGDGRGFSLANRLRNFYAGR